MSVPWGRPEAACMGSERRDCPLADPASVSRQGCRSAVSAGRSTAAASRPVALRLGPLASLLPS